MSGPGNIKHEKAFHDAGVDLSSAYHVYSIERTPEYIAWYLDGKLIKKSTSEQVKDFKDVPMQYRFNIWPSARSEFAGKFTGDELPVEHSIDWVQFSEYQPNSANKFHLKWKDDFSGDKLSERWKLGEWDSPGRLSRHDPKNVIMKGDRVILRLEKESPASNVNPSSKRPAIQ